LASGLPLSATIAKAKIMDWTGGSHASTFGGNPLACVAALAVIEAIKEERLLENATKQGTYILKRLEELKEASEIVGDVRGKGLMIGMELVEDKESKKPASEKAKKVMLRSWKRGVAVITCGVSTIRIMPPLNITKELVDAGLDIIEDVVKEVEKEKQ
jgi:4-aminobutyrate aminotransferase apoenzyme (EC 2.6.1.19)